MGSRGGEKEERDEKEEKDHTHGALAQFSALLPGNGRGAGTMG